MTEDDTPQDQKDAFVCPHCNAFSHQSWSELLARNGNSPMMPVYDFTEDIGSHRARWHRGTCAKCKKSTFWLDGLLIYPSANTLPVANPDMPETVLPLYNEARQVAAVSRRAGAALARSTLEVLLHEVLEEAKASTGLMDLIDMAYVKVSSGLGDLLTFIRIVGNSAVHVDEMPDDATVLVLDPSTTEAMDAMFAAINEVVDEMVTKPKQTAKFAGLIPAEKMADVLKKRAKREEQGS